jgi:hypothetical protein
MIPPEKKTPPNTAIFLNPKKFKRAPLNSPSIIPSAEFKLSIKVASSADKFRALNLSLNIKPNEVITGMMST